MASELSNKHRLEAWELWERMRHSGRVLAATGKWVYPTWPPQVPEHCQGFCSAPLWLHCARMEELRLTSRKRNLVSISQEWADRTYRWVGTGCLRNQFSLSTMWVPGLNGDCKSWWQMPLPTESSGLPVCPHFIRNSGILAQCIS